MKMLGGSGSSPESMSYTESMELAAKAVSVFDRPVSEMDQGRHSRYKHDSIPSKLALAASQGGYTIGDMVVTDMDGTLVLHAPADTTPYRKSEYSGINANYFVTKSDITDESGRKVGNFHQTIRGHVGRVATAASTSGGTLLANEALDGVVHPMARIGIGVGGAVLGLLGFSGVSLRHRRKKARNAIAAYEERKVTNAEFGLQLQNRGFLVTVKGINSDSDKTSFNMLPNSIDYRYRYGKDERVVNPALLALAAVRASRGSVEAWYDEIRPAAETLLAQLEIAKAARERKRVDAELSALTGTESLDKPEIDEAYSVATRQMVDDAAKLILIKRKYEILARQEENRLLTEKLITEALDVDIEKTQMAPQLSDLYSWMYAAMVKLDSQARNTPDIIEKMISDFKQAMALCTSTADVARVQYMFTQKYPMVEFGSSLYDGQDHHFKVIEKAPEPKSEPEPTRKSRRVYPHNDLQMFLNKPTNNKK